MYTFYLGESKLPIAPSKVTISTESQNHTLSLVDGKEINILKSPKLKKISFQALIPNSNYPFANYDGEYKYSDYYREAIEKLKNENDVIAFVITRTKGLKVFNYTGIYAVIEDITFTETVENGFDLAVNITLKEYEPYGPKFYSTLTDEKKVTTNTTTNNTQYTIQPGDSLWIIAKKKYGDGSKWKTIYENNKNVISDPNKINIGTTITLP